MSVERLETLLREHSDLQLEALAPTLARLVIDMAAELRDNQWADDGRYCHRCEVYRGLGHAPDCPLAALLGRVDALNQHTGT